MVFKNVLYLGWIRSISLFRIVMNHYTEHNTNKLIIRALRIPFSIFILICYIIINASLLLNQTAVASEGCEISQNLIREGEGLRDIVKNPDTTFYVRRYSERLSHYFNPDGTKEQGGNGSSLDEAFVVDKQDVKVLTICYDEIGKFPDVTKIVKIDNKIYYICCFSVRENNETKYFQVFFHMKCLTNLTPPLS